jgi:hypothetical protein
LLDAARSLAEEHYPGNSEMLAVIEASALHLAIEAELERDERAAVASSARPEPGYEAGDRVEYQLLPGIWVDAQVMHVLGRCLTLWLRPGLASGMASRRLPGVPVGSPDLRRAPAPAQ